MILHTAVDLDRSFHRKSTKIQKKKTEFIQGEQVVSVEAYVLERLVISPIQKK